MINLFSNKNESDPTYNKNLDDPYQDGANIRYVSISVTGSSGVDYLAKNSELRDRLIGYLNNLKREYGNYRANYNFINGK